METRAVGTDYVRVYPTEPERCWISGTVQVFRGTNPAGELVVVVLKIEAECLGGPLLYQISNGTGRIPASWLDNPDGQEWRRCDDWGAAVAEAHRWADKLYYGKKEG